MTYIVVVLKLINVSKINGMTVWSLSCFDTAVSSGISPSYNAKSFHHFLGAAACINDHTAAAIVLAATNHPKSMAPYDAD